MLKLLVLLAALMALANAVPCGGSPPNGEDLSNGCSCFSGFAGLDCSMDLRGSCDISPSDAMTTDKIATLVSANIADHRFTFDLEGNPKQGRSWEVSLRGPGNPSPACTYPGSSFITKGFLEDATCWDTFAGNFSADALVDFCAFNYELVAGGIELTGSLDVVTKEKVAVFNGVDIHRTTHSSLEFILTLPTNISVTTLDDMTISSAIDLQSAIILQEYDSEADAATVQILTSVQYPYQLYSLYFVSGQSLFNYNQAEISQGSQCPEQDGTPCTQTWEITISDVASSGVCVLDSSNSFQFDYGCRSGVFPCPVSGPSYADLSFSLESTNVCNQFELGFDVTAEMASYEDDSFSTPKVAFLADDRFYFLITFNSEISLFSAVVNEIRVVVDGTPKVIVSGGTAVDPVVGFSSSFHHVDGLVVNFYAVAGNPLDGFVVFDTQADGFITFSVEIDVVISYGVTLRKRSVSTKSFSVSRQFVLEAASSEGKGLKNSATTVSGTAGSLVAAALVAAILI